MMRYWVSLGAIIAVLSPPAFSQEESPIFSDGFECGVQRWSTICSDGTCNDGDSSEPCCGEAGVCVEEAPAPWSGPVMRFEDSSAVTPPLCNSGYPTLVGDYGFTLAAGGSCSCTCDESTGMTCNNATLEEHGGLACSTFTPDTQVVVPGECAGLDFALQTGPYYRFADPGITGGSCASNVINDLQAAEFDDQSRLCGGATVSPGCAENLLCVPDPTGPFDSKLCIYLSGDNPCPVASAYTERFLRYSSFTDTRDCGVCSCGGPFGTCGGTMTFQNGCDSSPVWVGSASPATCSYVGSSATHVWYSTEPSGTCSPSSGTVTGAAIAATPMTLCCMP